MLESVAGYRIVITHVKGENHHVADRLSRNPVASHLAPDFSVEPLQFCNRRRKLVRLGVDVEDPILKRLSVMAEDDQEYQKILADMDKYKDSRELGDGSFLKKHEGYMGCLSTMVIHPGRK